ncbi:MAG: acylphosphatase [Candidatus Pacebacteria bacterium]|nr:acylphosphatase [Candidatus Paceibacterota bacterium]
MINPQLHCIISGRVQGVAYREFVKNIARDMNLAGFVANLPDGSVEVVAQGEYGVLKVLLEHLAKGPANAIVTGVYDEWDQEPEKVFEDFKIM